MASATISLEVLAPDGERRTRRWTAMEESDPVLLAEDTVVWPSRRVVPSGFVAVLRWARGSTFFGPDEIGRAHV